MDRVQTIAVWIAALSLAILAAVTTLGYFAAEDHREAERVEWARVQEYQRAMAVWVCLDSLISMSLVGTGSTDLIGEQCDRVFSEPFDRPRDFVDE